MVVMELSSPEKELFFTIAWKIWGNRNNGWLNKPQTKASVLCSQALAYVEEFTEANQKHKLAISTSIKHWKPPMETFVKLNVAWKFIKA